MGKLELYQLAKYLPYELKLNIKGNNEWILYEFGGLDGAVALLVGRGRIDLFDIKPILRPLSDLIIERDGKIDMVEIAKICTPVVLNPKCNISEYCIGVRFEDMEGDIMVLAYTFNMRCFGLHKRPTGEFSLCCCQAEMFEYLFANHYDVYGLIEEGLAININTL